MSFHEYITPITNGAYCVRLVKNEKELRLYQDLRYRHLILEFNPQKAATDPAGTTDYNIGYDKDTSQLCCFYKNPETGEDEVVGGYVLMRFRTDDQFCKATLKYDLSKLFAAHKREILEATRAVTHPDHRKCGTVAKLLWQGIEAYAEKFHLRYVIGTMSFAGVDPLIYADAADYLHHYYRMDESILVKPLPGYAYFPAIKPIERVNRSSAIRQIPPLLKGYLWIGAKVGEAFCIDKELNTVEVFAILDMKKYALTKTNVRRLK